MSYPKTGSGIGLVLFMATNAWAQAAEPAAEPAPAVRSGIAANAPASETKSGYTSAALQVGYGTHDVNLGLGVRGGYTLPMNVYVGANFMYYVGGTSQVYYYFAPSQGLSVHVDTTTVKASLWTLVVEGGYDFNLTPAFMLRPVLGLGMASAKTEVCLGSTCNSDSKSKFAVTPGVTASLNFGKPFVGADFRYLIISGSNAAVFGAHVGMKF